MTYADEIQKDVEKALFKSAPFVPKNVENDRDNFCRHVFNFSVA